MTKPGKQAGTRNLSGVNAVRMLELLVDHPDGLGISEVAHELAMDTAQAHRLANGLGAAGYIAKTDSRPARYVVTSKVLRLAARLLDQTDLTHVAEPIMTRLRDVTGETVHLAAITEGQPVCVARELSHRRLSVLTRIGDVWPLNETAMGWVALAFGPDAGRGDLGPDVEAHVAEAREHGVAVDSEVYVKGVVGVAAPIFNFHRRLVGALAVAGPTDRVPEDEVARFSKLVLDGAREISEALGCLAVDELYHPTTA